jgi:MoaA/NifB/PqqE/SkfB family radical SAM enzyme
MKLNKKVNFDVCTFCNHACTFCSNPDERTIKAKVSLSQFKKVMDNIIRYIQIDEIGLSAKGEVLINNDLDKIISSVKHDYGIPYTYISSNGALATKKTMEKLLSSGLDSTKFSINALTQQTYKKVHLKDDFHLVIENLKSLISLKKTKYQNHKIFISSVISMDINQLKNSFKTILGEEDYNYINDIFLYNLDYTPKFEEIHKDTPITKKCSIPFNEIYINSDCTLGFCCKDYFDEISFGSLLKHDFLELYNSKEYEDLRKMHINSHFPDNHICKNCLLYGDA